MDAVLAVKTMRRQSWQLMLREHAESGLSVRDWCAANGISTKTFYYRRKQLQTMLLDAAQPATFAELIPPKGASDHPEKTLASVFRPQLTITVGDAVMGIDQNTPKHLIAEVMELIRNA